MAFEVGADSYGRFIGRFSEQLADQLVALVDVQRGQRVLDVGCGPGALTARLVERLGADAVSAVDPSEQFVAAVQSRLPDVDVERASAEKLPYPDDSFDLALAQLVVHFMTDPVAGLVEMARVTRPGGMVAASVWDHAGGGGPLSLFWRAVRDVDPHSTDESGLAGAREGHLAELFAGAGLHGIEATSLTVRVQYESFLEWWEPFMLGVGPAGDYVASLDDAGRDALRDRCAELLPAPPFEIVACAWTALGRAS